MDRWEFRQSLRRVLLEVCVYERFLDETLDFLGVVRVFKVCSSFSKLRR